MYTTAVSIPGIVGPENVENQSLPMMSKDVKSTSRSCPKIYEKLLYEWLKSF